ncbi:4-hydroxy-tetrahydrodipicolinate reductase [Emcibacteraceae bacterium]|jgi:4-hydroxy-tetrahydrodipicolinate reductase|nr:4-hydroxy-tetrahydrodipicolinate reductase [Emcibacteraceae bacterium]|tara:strand:- start:695 stop:1456 length:762 start_codon:yes stop_codon:yes gene_type:complete
MIKVGISGANGKMGRLAIKVIEAADDLTVGGLYAPGRHDQDILGYSASGDQAALYQCDVIVEMSNPEAADENVPRWLGCGADVLIGTSGYTLERLEKLRSSWSDLNSRCLVIPNFAIGAVLMMRCAELAAPHFESAEIVEMHHYDKPDAPSGTALHTASRIAAARKHGVHDRGTELMVGSLGGDVEGVPVHSIRLHGSAAHQEVIFGTLGQYLTIRHDTVNYECFEPGVTLALRKISSLESGVTVGLETLLGI